MKVCKVHPSKNTCCSCIDIQVTNEEVYDCKACLSKKKDYEILGFVSGILEAQAILLDYDSKCFTVPISRLYDIREV